MESESCNNWLLIAVFIIGITSLVGFFITKKKGFGRFTTSTFLLLLVVILSAIFFAEGKLKPELLTNILFAVIGFAGGLFTKKDSDNTGDSSAP